MKTFSFLFGILNKRILQRTDILAKKLQGYDVSAAEGLDMANTVLLEMEAERCDDEFNRFWEEVELDGRKFKVEEFKLPRNMNPNLSPKDFFRRIYFETYDRIHATITDRFNQEDFKIYRDIQVCSMQCGESLIRLN